MYCAMNFEFYLDLIIFHVGLLLFIKITIFSTYLFMAVQNYVDHRVRVTKLCRSWVDHNVLRYAQN